MQLNIIRPFKAVLKLLILAGIVWFFFFNILYFCTNIFSSQLLQSKLVKLVSTLCENFYFFLKKINLPLLIFIIILSLTLALASTVSFYFSSHFLLPTIQEIEKSMLTLVTLMPCIFCSYCCKFDDDRFKVILVIYVQISVCLSLLLFQYLRVFCVFWILTLLLFLGALNYIIESDLPLRGNVESALYLYVSDFFYVFNSSSRFLLENYIKKFAFQVSNG